MTDMPLITSLQNPTVRRLKSLSDRKGRGEYGEMLVEGEKLMREAVQARLVPSDILIDAEKAQPYADLAARMKECGARVCLAPAHIVAAVCETKTPQGVCGAFSLPALFCADAAPDTLVALDGVQDPGNVGTIWRTADAAGFGGMMLTRACADPFSPKVQRAAMGSGFRVPACVTDDLAGTLVSLAGRGWTVIASSLRGDPFYDMPGPADRFVLVIGSEARGVSEEVLSAADRIVRLPMRGGAESLNAAVAAGIMMYELTRW